MRASRPLLRLDAGWLFLAAGLAMCVTGLLVPAQEELEALSAQRDRLLEQELAMQARLKAHSDFLDDLDRADPSLVRRLAASQLNLTRADERPVLLATSANRPVTAWIDAAVPSEPPQHHEHRRSWLSRLAGGPARLWLLGAGILCVFISLIHDLRLPGTEPHD